MGSARAYQRAIASLRRSRRIAARVGRATLAGLLIAVVGLQAMPVSAFAAPVPVLQLATTAPAQTAPGSQVVDYTGGTSTSVAARLRRADMGVVVRYVGAKQWKSLTRKEADTLRAQGIDIAAVYETKATWMLAGRKAGVSAAKTARAAIIKCGGPRKPFVYFACDTATHNYAAVNACLRGAASVLGADHVGIYGSYPVCASALKSGYATKAWQTEAWSGGKVLPQAVLYQTAHRFNGGLGIDYDSNFLRADDIGQWGYAPVGEVAWTPQSASTTATLRGVAFRDASTGLAVGDAGVALRTADGGSTWTTASVPATGALDAVAFTGSGAGIAVGDGGEIARTSDTGSTWTTASAPATTTLRGVACLGATDGLAVGDAGTILRTADCGSSWTSALVPPATGALSSVAYASAGAACAVGEAGAVLLTTDGGSTWAAVSTPATATLRSVAFPSATDGWAVGAAATVMRTGDGGATWTRVSTPATGTLTSVAFPNVNTGWAVTEAGTVIHTTDGGYTWTLATTPAVGALASVAFSDAKSGWAVGESGAILRASKSGVDFFGHVAGVVTDAVTGAPVSGAFVQIGSRQPVPTATDGSFVAARITPGTYSVTVTSPRYITLAKGGVVVSAAATAMVRMRPTPRAVTRLTMPVVSQDSTASGAPASIAATLSPGSAASSTVCVAYLSHYEQKTVVKKVKGRRKKVKVWYWRQRATFRMTAASSGPLLIRTTLPTGRWRTYVVCGGSGIFLPSASAVQNFRIW
ncbi:MAG: YCF48-related protein [Coriobacteriia bacterium]|nr:YCF48-related protein [Coriobacteriia bacterium]